MQLVQDVLAPKSICWKVGSGIPAGGEQEELNSRMKTITTTGHNLNPKFNLIILLTLRHSLKFMYI